MSCLRPVNLGSAQSTHIAAETGVCRPRIESLRFGFLYTTHGRSAWNLWLTTSDYITLEARACVHGSFEGIDWRVQRSRLDARVQSGGGEGHEDAIKGFGGLEHTSENGAFGSNLLHLFRKETEIEQRLLSTLDLLTFQPRLLLFPSLSYSLISFT